MLIRKILKLNNVESVCMRVNAVLVFIMKLPFYSQSINKKSAFSILTRVIVCGGKLPATYSGRLHYSKHSFAYLHEK